MTLQSHISFKNRLLPYLFLLPQIMVTLVFFIWPAALALWGSVLSVDPFGVSGRFVGLDNFVALFEDSYYYRSFATTVIFCSLVTIVGMCISLVMACLVDYVGRGKKIYQTLFILPYAIAPAIAGVLWMFLFSPGIGLVSYYLTKIGYPFNYAQNGSQAMFLVVLASIWQQTSYNFLFFLAALQSIPHSLIEAAAMDGAGAIRRFFGISLPLIAPVSFFLLVVNLIYAFFETFPIIDTVTSGGPVEATTTLIYKIYREGFVGLDLSSAAAQSVVLMVMVIMLTVAQFHFLERRIQYK